MDRSPRPEGGPADYEEVEGGEVGRIPFVLCIVGIVGASWSEVKTVLLTISDPC